MRPRLKNSTLYVPSAEGVYIISNSGTLTLKGKQIYQWLDGIAPYLDGKHTLAEITNNLSDSRRELVTNLVRALLDKGFVKDVTGELPHTFDADEIATYASEIAFIDYYVDSPAHRFERFRTSRVLALGAGRTLTALVQANLHAGLKQVHVAPTAECAVNSARHTELLERAQRRDPRETLVERPVNEWSADAAALDVALAPYDAVIHVSDRPMRGRARRLNRACVAQGKRLIQAIIEGDRAWIGPLVGVDAGAACWECAWLRRLGHRSDPESDDAFADLPDARVSEFLAGPTAAIVSNQMSFEIFKHITGGGPLETAATLLGVDLETLESKAHPVMRHPLCTAHGEVAPHGEAELLDAIRRREQGPEIDPEAFSKQAARLFDEVTGILGSLAEHDFEQLPLKVSQARVSNPMAVRDLGAPVLAIGVATDFALARQRATRRACELYAASAAAGIAAGDQIWAYDLASRTARAIGADAVFPILAGAPASADAPGLASGFSWSEAVVRGLLAQCARLTIAELAQAGAPVPLLDLDALPRIGNTARYARVLGIAGESLSIYDVTGALEVPTLAACLGDDTVAYVSGLDVPQLVESVLELAVQSYQARAHHQPAYAPRSVPELPHALRGPAVAPRRSARSIAWPEMQDFLVRQVTRAGWRPMVALLDRDPVIETVLPYIVRVVLVPGEGDG